jgi:hypothetical protein
MSEIVVEELESQENEIPTVLSPNRIRDALLSLIMHFGNSDFSVIDVLREALTSDESRFLTASDREFLIKIVSDRTLFSHLRYLGTRIATFTVNPATGTGMNTNVARAHRSEIINLRRQWDAAIDDMRNSEYLRQQRVVDSEGRVISRTLNGANFPRLISHSESQEALKASEHKADYAIMTDFSGWAGMEKMYAKDEDDYDGEYSTSAEDSDFVYKSPVLKVKFQTKQVSLSSHAKDRLKAYGYKGDMAELVVTKLDARVSSGRSVPDIAKEQRDGRRNQIGDMTYRLTIELDDVDITIGGTDKMKAKLVVSCFVKPQINKVNVLLEEFLKQSTDPLTLHSVRFVTVIPKLKLTGDHGLRCTGMPVIPYYVDNVTASPAVTIVRSEMDKREPSYVIDSFNMLLSRTNQWINLRHEVIEEFLRGRPRQREQFDAGNYLMATETGVEFADVEYLREINAPLLNKLERFGFLLVKLSIGNAEGSSLDEIGLKVKDFIDDNIGPSIVHSEEIRSPYTEFASSTKPLNSSLLITRLVLSLLLMVGVGDTSAHDRDAATNPRKTPDPHHLINQKRAEAMLIPVSVMKDYLAVYSIHGSVGRLLKEVSTDLLAKSGLAFITSGSYNVQAGLNELEQGNVQLAFTTRAPLVRISSLAERKELSLVAPSGLEYDTSLIINDIISQMRSRAVRLPQARAVCAWHPLFTIVVSEVPKFKGKMAISSYHAIVMPAKRKSSIATSYHNQGDSLRTVDHAEEFKVHYGLMREEKGFLSGLLTHIFRMSLMPTT